MASVWITKRKGKRGVRYNVRGIEPESGITRSKAFTELDKARDCQSELKRAIKNNDYFAPVKISYEDWVKQHLENMRNSPDVDVSPKTIAGHYEALKILKEVCRPKGPIEITLKMIKRFRRVLLEKGQAKATVNKHIRHIRSALSYAVDDEILPTNKLKGQKKLTLTEDEKDVRVLEVGEAVAIMNAAVDLRQKSVISLAYYHGMRRAEICYLQWQDVDLEENQLKVLNREDAKTKTRRSRTVALRQETAVLLAELYQDRVNRFVFTNPKSFYWSCGKWFKKLVEMTEIDYCTLHDLRETCNTTMKDAGIDEEVAMQVLGHSSVNTNRKYYTGRLTRQLRMAVEVLPSIG